MNTLEERLSKELRARADELPAVSGDIERVRRVGCRRELGARIAAAGAAVAVVVAVAATFSALDGVSGDTEMADGGERIVFEDGHVLSVSGTTTRLVACLQARGFGVVQEGDAITFDNRVVDEDAFDTAKASCEDELVRYGYLLPSDDPDNLEVLHSQFQRLADCYRSAGLEISRAPPLTEFVDARQAGRPGWTPQAEAARQADPAMVHQIEADCDIPAPGEASSVD